jgi:hypothetical protein
MSTTTPDPQPQVIYVKQVGNGLAIAGLITGIAGLTLGLSMNILFPGAIGAGLVAVVLGALGLRKASRVPEAGHKPMSWIAVTLGILSLSAGVYGAVQVNQAVTDLQQATVTLSGHAKSASPQASTSAPQQAKVGDTLTLTGNSGERMAVTVTGVMDPLQVGQGDQADSGQRFIGVQITLKNVGSAAYSDSPSNGATLLSNANEQAQSGLVSGGPCGNNFATSANIAPGNVQQGCIPFEMPTGQTPATFQFTLDSGFANQTGQWSLQDAVTSPAGTPSVAANSVAPNSVETNTGTATSMSNSAPATTTGTTATSAIAALPNQCSPGVSATAHISCGLASNLYYEYYEAEQTSGETTALSVWSPVTRQYYNVTCSPGNGVIYCSVSGTTDPNAQVDLTQAALDAYSPQQASSYAANHDLGPNG